MKRPLLVLVLCGLLVLSACGGGGGTEAPAAASPGAAPTAAAGFFQRQDTDGVNAAAGPAQAAAERASSGKSMKRCNRAGERGYDAWRSCWHGLLGPLQSSLGGLAVMFGDLADQDLPAVCVEELTAAKKKFEALAGRTERLLAGIDSKRRKAQVSAMDSYGKTLTDASAAFGATFQTLTGACYSPQDLASINAGPTPSP